MGMLERIKKRQWEGLKDFVESLESSATHHRQMIMMNGILEDPLFMRWVTKNLKGFKDFLDLSSDQVDDVIRSNESMISVLAKALPVSNQDELQQYAQLCPRVFSKLRDEVSYLKDVPVLEREAAQKFIMKTVRKMQKEERIPGFHWQLPPQDVFYEKTSLKDGKAQICFEDGTVAAEGEIFKGKRIGKWQHYYDNGRLLGEGVYQEGIKNGSWIFFYGNGARRAEGKFLNDARHGLWREWDREGNPSEVDWKEGKRQSE
jgi:hypothetical protein